MNSRIAMKTLNELNYSDTDYLSSPNALIGGPVTLRRTTGFPIKAFGNDETGGVGI